jgi:hypothetical protein
MKSAPASRVTIDFMTLEDETETVRERDIVSRIRLLINEVPAYRKSGLKAPVIHPGDEKSFLFRWRRWVGPKRSRSRRA